MSIIDLTMPLDERTPVFPGDPPFKSTITVTVTLKGYEERRLSFGSHLGTHVDAPSHMIVGGKTLSELPLTQMVGEAVVLDVRGKHRIDVVVNDVRPNDIVFFCTGHSERALLPDYFTNSPVLTTTLAERLVEVGVKAVGIDSYTVDKHPYEVHHILLRRDILIVENLVNLEQLVGKRFQCFILPLKLTGADGAPCRVVGIL